MFLLKKTYHEKPESHDPEESDSIKVELINNRIYFYNGVDEDSILALNKHMQSLLVKAQIHAVTNDVPLVNSGQIFIHIQSFGGSVFSGMSGMDTILDISKKLPVTTIVDGCAASAATFLSIAGTKRLMRKNSYMLIHQLSSGVWGKYEEIKDEMSNAELLMSTIRNVYAEHTKIPKRELNNILKRDLWWNAEKCLAYGLIDEII